MNPTPPQQEELHRLVVRELDRLLKTRPVPTDVRAVKPMPLVPAGGPAEARPAEAGTAAAPSGAPEIRPPAQPEPPGTLQLPQAPPSSPGPGGDHGLAAACSVASAVARSLARAQVELAVEMQTGLSRLAALLGEASQLVQQLQQLTPGVNRSNGPGTSPPPP